MRRMLMMTCCLLLMWSAALVMAQGQEQAPQAQENPQPVDPIAAAIEEVNKQDNGITINRADKSIDIKAKVCMRTGEFLEMFACTKDTREHESILVMDAMPSTIHLGLLLLGLEPGKPLSYDRAFDPPKLVEATGPRVGVFVVLDVAGQKQETPANRWVQDNKTGEMMKDHVWLFAGSVQTEYDGKPVYLADVNGSAISLVNFGDDLLTLASSMTAENESHGKVWAPRTQAIPKVGTEVVIRLRVLEEKEQDKAGQGQEQEPAAEKTPEVAPEAAPEAAPDSPKAPESPQSPQAPAAGGQP